MLNMFKAIIFGLSSITLTSLQGPYPIPRGDLNTIYKEKIFSTFDGLRLHGHLALPRHASGKIPVVILLVGSGSINRYENIPGEMTADGKPTLLFKDIEDTFINQGIAVFTYDKRGVLSGDDTFKNSVLTEDFQSATAENLAADAIAAFDLVQTFPEVDANRVSLLGHSEGTILALKVAENRPAAHSLFLLGLFTRGFDDLLYHQTVTSNMRIMTLIDVNKDGYLDENEVTIFHQEAPQNIPDWNTLLEIMDITKDGYISHSEQRFYFEQASRDFLKAVHDEKSPWAGTIPRAWFSQYIAEGSFTQRFAVFCSKIHVFHGEADAQTPFEDALELRQTCLDSGSPLNSFSSFRDSGHGFSPRIGLRGWKNTIGPMDANVLKQIGEVAKTEMETSLK